MEALSEVIRFCGIEIRPLQRYSHTTMPLDAVLSVSEIIAERVFVLFLICFGEILFFPFCDLREP